MEVEDISTDSNFKADLEMSSFDTMCFVTDVKTVFGVDLKVKDFIEHKTVGEMAEYIASLR
ncbi:MAG: acyl carrier protein [Clostridia bacterium]|nr:acyl carrier protein [Clostridia bacterium]